MGNIKLGTLDISNIIVNTRDVSKIYLGQIEVYSPTPTPVIDLVKGDIISFDALWNGTQKRFKVLDINGAVAKLFYLDNDLSSKFNVSDTQVEFDGGNLGQKYADSTLDTYLNTTYYNSLGATIKSAIVPEYRTQIMYDFKNTDNPSYDYHEQYNFSSDYMKGLPIIDKVSIGNRNVFALDLKDIFDYVEKNTITSDELNDLFYGETPSTVRYVWCSSAYVGNPKSAFYEFSKSGFLDYAQYNSSFIVRPVFNINLSTIEYTKE